MTHQDFVAAYHAGAIRVKIDRDAAARLVAGRSMLPLVLLPVLGLGVALAIVGHFILGAIIFVAALGVRFLVRRSSAGYLVWRALQEPEFYRELLAAQVLAIEECSTPSRSS
jgi:hypothetical protein